MVIAEQMELQARDDLREKTAKSGKRNEPAIVGRRRYKIKSCLEAQSVPDRFITNTIR
jgi:hypothetical protein